MTQSDGIQLMIAIPAVLGLLWGVGKIVHNVGQTVDKILREVTPNSGKSLKDRVMKIEGRLDKQDYVMEVQSKVLEDQNQTLSRIERMEGLKGDIWERIEQRLEEDERKT